MKRLTIMCPVYNEEGVVPLFFARIRPIMEKLSSRYAVDLVFMNNASTDGTLAAIDRIRAQHPNVYVISLSRNVGYQRSLECGLRNAKGDLFVFIDVDCEDPPEMLLDFAAKYEEGFDIVYGERADREEPRAIRSARKLFYRIVRAVADEDIVLDMAEFGMFTAEVREAILQDNDSFPFIRSSISRVGFRRIGIPFKRQRRIAGETHYNLIGLTIFAIAGILTASTLPLRLPIYALPFWILSLIAIGIAYVLTGSPWAALSDVLLFAIYLGTSVAFIAIYVARTYKNGLGRPNFYIDHRHTVLQPDAAPVEAARAARSIGLR